MGCQPPEANRLLASEIEQFVAAMEQEIAKFEGNQNYLNAEQKKVQRKKCCAQKETW